MPTDSSTTSVVAALCVAVAAVGHLLVGGGSIPLGVVPPLAALAGACWLLGEHLADERLLSALVLIAVQLFVHVTLDSATMQHDMAMPGSGVRGSLIMSATHLSVLLAGVLALSRARRWLVRIVRLLARFLPELPVLHPVRRLAAVPPDVSESPRLAQRWLSSNVSRRGPPVVRVDPAV